MSSSTVPMRVARRTGQDEGIGGLELAPFGDCLLPAFSAGSHIDLHIGEHLVRQYSLCNSPDERHRYVIAVLLDPQSRGGSRWVHDMRYGLAGLQPA